MFTPNSGASQPRSGRMPRIRLGRVASLALSLLIGPALLIALSFVLAQPARAAAYVVTNTNDSGPGSLREAILNANASAGADVITFDLSGCPCSIGLASTLTVNNALTIYGPGASQLALDGGSAVQVIATTNVPVSISDLTIRNGMAASTGGGIIASGALTLTQVTLQGNSANYGGGLYATGKTRVIDSVFDNNSATLYQGGGMYVSSELSVSGSQFYNNRTTHYNGYGGGAGLMAFGPTSISTTSFISNTTTDWGGGAYIANYTDKTAVQLTLVQFISNTALNGGGGGLFSWFTTTLETVDFFDNYSGSSGGGLYGGYGGDYRLLIHGGQMRRNSATGGGGLYSDGNFTLDATAVLSNTARSGNGGGAWTLMNATVSNASFDNNTVEAVGNGGGIYTSGSLTLTSTSLFENQTLSGGGGGSGSGGNTTVINSQYISNTAHGDGGGLLAIGTARVSRSRFTDNSSTTDGGAIYASNPLDVDQTQFLANQANTGGAVFLSGGSGTIVNTLFARNHASSSVGEALALSPAGTLSIQHTTVATPTLASGSAVFVNGGTVELLNSIVANHSVGIVQAAGSVSADYNLFYGNLVDTQGGGITNSHPIAGNPAFFDPQQDDYHLGAGSAAVNAGLNISVSIDFDGDVRPQGSGYDVGYDEVAPPEGLTASNDSPTPLGSPTSFSAAVVFGTAVTYQWDFDDGTTGSGRLVMHTYAAMGEYHVTVTAANGGGRLSTTTTVTVVEAPVTKIYLPIVRR